MASEVVAVDGDVAVVRAEVEYAATRNRVARPVGAAVRDDGRCRAFEEWPFAPGRSRDGH